MVSFMHIEAWDRGGPDELQVTQSVRMKCQGRGTNPEQTTRSEDWAPPPNQWGASLICMVSTHGPSRGIHLPLDSESKGPCSRTYSERKVVQIEMTRPWDWLGFLPGQGEQGFLFSLICPLIAFVLCSCQNKTSLSNCSTRSVLFSFAMFCLAASNLFIRRNNASLAHALRNPFL